MRDFSCRPVFRILFYLVCYPRVSKNVCYPWFKIGGVKDSVDLTVHIGTSGIDCYLSLKFPLYLVSKYHALIHVLIIHDVVRGGAPSPSPPVFLVFPRERFTIYIIYIYKKK